MQRNRTSFFRNSPITGEMSARDLDWLDTVSETVHARKRQSLWLHRQQADRVYFVRSGLVKISLCGGDGRDLTLHLVPRGSLVGELALVGAGVHETQAESYEESVLYAVQRDDFLTLMRRSPQLTHHVMRVIADRRRDIERRVESLIFKTAHARLADLFLRLSAQFGVRDARGVIVNIRLTHKEMAALIGASRETVSFAILDLRKEGLILTEDKRVVILDERALEQLRDG